MVVLAHRSRRASLVAATALVAACSSTPDGSEDVAPEIMNATAPVVSSCEIVVRGTVPGDYELDADPQDAAGGLVFATHGPTSSEDSAVAAPILVARLDGQTGMQVGAPVTIANNYKGIGYYNGPELVFDGAKRRLGVLFRGPDGVHAAWRSSTWAADGRPWSSFDQTYEGTPITNGAPPKLAGTTLGRYPAGSPPFGLTSYSEFLGPHDPPTAKTCTEQCYGYFGGKATTDVKRVLLESGRFATFFYSTPHPARSGVVLFSGCATADATTCGLWEAQIAETRDASGAPKGTLDPASVRQLAVDTQVRYDNMEELRAVLHPVTGDLVVFAGGHLGGKGGIDVLTCATAGQGAACTQLKRIARFPWDVSYSGHFRVVATSDRAYLHFLVRPIPLEAPGSPTYDDPAPNPREIVGSYVIGVTEANVRGTSPVASPARIDPHHAGAELVYMPAARKAALFFKETVQGEDALQRCWL